MRFFHLSDLHLGRRLCELSLIDDQRYILEQILLLCDENKPDAVLISGDIYDKPVPTIEAVRLLDDFLAGLSSRKIAVIAIAGNHDSPERVGFGAHLMRNSGVYLAHEYSGELERVTLTDELGEVDFYLLPFVKPANVRRFFPDSGEPDATEAVKIALDSAKIDPNRRSVLLSHQFVTGAERSDSEEISVGGADNVELSAYEGFDYVALGHIHRPQTLGQRARYCGSPLKYSFSEASHEKNVTIVELLGKGELRLEYAQLVPLHEMRELKGSYSELTLKQNWENSTLRDDFVHITLTDEDDIPDAAAKLRVIYKNLLRLDYDNSRTRLGAQPIEAATDKRTPLELFADFFERQNGRPMSPEQADFMRELTERIFEL